MHADSAFPILIIDDEEDFATTLATRLELRGMEVRTAFSGKEGLAVLETWAPGLILLDMRMPEMSGIEVLRILRHNHPVLPVLIITGQCPEQDHDAALALDVQGYHTKPLDFEELMAGVQAIADKWSVPAT